VKRAEVEIGGLLGAAAAALWVAGEEGLVEQKGMRAGYDELVRVRLGVKPGELGMELVEADVLCNAPGVDEDVARGQIRLMVMCVGDADYRDQRLCCRLVERRRR
jgi:hypothetical protein